MRDFVAIDIETADYGNSRPCSFGYARVADGSIVEHASYLIDPQITNFNPVAVRIHGITPAMVAGKPSLPEIWPEIYDLLNNRCVVAHNATFDVGVLRRASEFYHLKMPSFTVYCTMRIAKETFFMADVKLPAVCASIGVPLDHHHDAEADAVACANVMLHFSSGESIIKCSMECKTIDVDAVIASLDEYETACIEWFYQFASSASLDLNMIRISKGKTLDICHQYYIARIGYVRKRHYWSVKRERARLVPDEIEHDTLSTLNRYYLAPDDFDMLADYVSATVQERVAAWDEYCETVSERSIKKRLKEYYSDSIGLEEAVFAIKSKKEREAEL